MTTQDLQPIVTADEALQRLIEGNKRFVANVRGMDAIVSQMKRAELVVSQHPFAVILGCSDSRVPAEIVFDQGLGDLFVIRVAGNIVAPSQLGSVEFACGRFGTALVVVLGHSRCGAVEATLDHVSGGGGGSRNVMSIVDRIVPAVKPIVESASEMTRDELWAEAVRANVRISANQIRHGTKLLEDRVAAGRLRVVGAEYNLSTGTVDFFEGV
jgi:carbonic anhydrase